MDFNKLNLCGYKYKYGCIYASSKKDDEKDKIICNQLLYPSKIIYNLEEETFKVELQFIENNQEKSIIVDKEAISSKSKIISLSNYGIYVNSNNANRIITYLSEIIAHNGNVIPRVKSVSRLGWVKDEFIPFSDKIIFDGALAYKDNYRAITSPIGNYDDWKKEIQKVRKNKIVRLITNASFASPMLEFTGSLPFVVLLWGGTGFGKTVALNVAASVWGNPNGEGLINSLDSTKNYSYRTMAMFHDITAFFDELQNYEGSKNKLVMTITQGVDRGKADKDKGNKKKETWKNVAIFTGEDSISSANSGGGTLNRLIEIYINQPLFDDYMGIMDFIRENNGMAGRKFVEYIISRGKPYIKNLYKEILAEITKLNKTAGKQASSMANILVVDRLLNEFMFDEEPLTIDDVKDFMFFKEEIDISERAYDYFIDEATKNSICFIKETEGLNISDGADNKREFWGSINDYEIMILRSQFDKIIKNGGYDPKKTTKEWADKDYLIRNSQGKYNHQTTVNKLKANFLKIRIIDREKPKEKEKKNGDDFLNQDYVDSYMQEKLPW